MLTHPMLDQLAQLGLTGMAQAFAELDASGNAATAMASHAAAPTPDFAGIADDLETAWKTPSVTMRTRQQLLRTLVNEIT